MAGMTDRLSDERLRQLVESQMEWHSTEFVVVPMARELLELRAKLSAGPVMPEVPSDDQWDRMADRLFDGRLCDVYAAIRDALLAGAGGA